MAQTLLSPGDEVAGYLILREIDSSPIGPLFMAEGPGSVRVRVRLLAEGVWADKEQRARLQRDLATLEQVDHPRVARLVFRSEEPAAYGLAHGGSVTLAEAVLQGRPLNEAELVWVGQGLCEGLARLHDAGLPHGELSTHTVVLTREGPVIHDLGWSRRLAGQDPTLTGDLRALTALLELCAGGDLAAVSEDVAALVRVLDMGSAREGAQAFAATARRLELGDPDLSDFLALLDASHAAAPALPSGRPQPPRSLLDAKPDARVETRREIEDRRARESAEESAESVESAESDEGQASDADDLAAGTSESALETISDEELAELERDVEDDDDDDDDDDESSAYSDEEDADDDQFDSQGVYRPHIDDASSEDEFDDDDAQADESSDEYDGPRAPARRESGESSDEYEGPRARARREPGEPPPTPEPKPLPPPERAKELSGSDIATLAQSASMDGEVELPPLRASHDDPGASGDELDDVSSGAHTPLPAASDVDDRSAEGPAFASGEGLPPVVTPPDLAESQEGLADSGETPVVDAAPLHERIDRFQPLEELARTQVHTTFLALDTEADQRVALRVYRSGVPKQDSERKRLLREAESAEGLEHPAFVRIRESGQAGDRLWVAMDVPPGRPLTLVWADDAVSDGALLAAMLEVCQAVDHANGVGITAGSLSPGDVRVTSDGSARLVAYGVGSWVGSKQGRGTVNPAREARALGVMIYQALTRGTDPEQASGLPRRLLGEPPAPSCYAPLPAELDAVLLQALRADKGYSSPAELAKDLERVVRGGAPLAPAPGAGYRLKQLVALHPMLPAMLVVLLLGLGVGFLERDALRDLAGLPPAESPAPTAGPVPDETLPPTPGVTPPPGPATGPAEAVTELALAKRLQTLGQEAEAQDDLAGARLLYNESLDLWLSTDEPPPAQLEAALDRVLERLRELEHQRQAEAEADSASAQLEAAAKARAERGQQALGRGREALDAGRLPEARQALIEALLAGEARAEPLLAHAEDGLAAERVSQALAARGDARPQADPAEVERLVRERLAAERAEREAAAGQESTDRREQARQLVRQGARALEQRDYEAARRAFLGALALDPEQPHVAEGLSRLAKAEAQAATAERARRVAELLGAAREASQEARSEEGQRRVAAYARALGNLESALLLDPENKTLTSERDDVVKALADLLGDGGPAGWALQANREDPEDPYLQIVEADRVAVDRTLGGNVRFEPTRVLDALRDWVKSFEGGRFQLTVQVRSRAETARDRPPRVIATGLQLRVLDKQAKTLYPWRNYAFADGTHYRNVVVDAAGRIVRPFDTAHSLRVPEEVERITALAKELLLEARARTRPGADSAD